MRLGILAAAAALAAGTIAAQADDAQDCTQGDDPQLSIQGCTKPDRRR